MSRHKPKAKKILRWLQICKPCPKSPTGKHEFYVPVGPIGKLRARWNLWFDRLGGQEKSVHRRSCPVCGNRQSVIIKRILEKVVLEENVDVDGKD